MNEAKPSAVTMNEAKPLAFANEANPYVCHCGADSSGPFSDEACTRNDWSPYDGPPGWLRCDRGHVRMVVGVEDAARAEGIAEGRRQMRDEAVRLANRQIDRVRALPPSEWDRGSELELGELREDIAALPVDASEKGGGPNTAAASRDDALICLATAMNEAAERLSSTRWNPSGDLAGWSDSTQDGRNHRVVCEALDIIRAALKGGG